MGILEKVIESPSGTMLSLLLAIYAIKEAYELAKWWKARADGYHRSRSDDERIASTSEMHTEALARISEALDMISERLDLAERERKEDTIANSRAWLYQLYGTLRDKPTVTPNEYETFRDLADRYLAAGGNSVFRDKIIPDILAKDIEND